jgi:purine-binding chemotaxis protein CheW
MDGVVTFTLDGATYGIGVGRVREILDLRAVAPLPNAPAHLMGLIDLRGGTVPVVDLRRLLALPPAPDTPQTRILVVWTRADGAGPVVGLRTDRVIEVARLDHPVLDPLSDAQDIAAACPAIAGIGRREGAIVTILDLGRLFDAAPGALPAVA